LSAAGEGEAVLEGHVSVAAALRSGSREVYRVLIRRDKSDGAVRGVERAARAAGVPVERVAPGEIDALASGRTHGGVAAAVGPRRFVELEELLSGDAPWIVMLDGVEDPFNFGAAVRALWAAGAAGLIVRPRNWMSAAGTVARASAGASEWIPTAVAETAHEAADFLGERGLTIACATGERDAATMHEADLSGPLFLMIGGERRGVTRSFMDRADLLLRVPYGRKVSYSLGTASASAVLAFEVMRQRAARC
jgi:23S rRNA (guanosine2251-2'-O)-methyltransferase